MISERRDQALGPEEKNFWTLGEDGTPQPQPDFSAATWREWMAEQKPRISFRLQVSKQISVGVQFAGVELGLNSSGQPLLWRVAFFLHGKPVMHGKLNTLEALDQYILRGKGAKHLKKFRVGRWGILRLRLRYLKWRKTLGGFPGWRQVLWPKNPVNGL